MKNLNEYTLNIFGLSNKLHHFTYKLEEDFYAFFDTGIVYGGNIDVVLDFDKSDLRIECNFTLKGEVTVLCDRTLEPFEVEIDTQAKVFYKYADTTEEVDEKMFLIEWSTQQLNLAQLFYEYTILALPIRKIHPKFANESEDEKFTFSTEKEDNIDNDDSVGDNSHWAVLKNLKNKK